LTATGPEEFGGIARGANMDKNIHIIEGRLGQDPEVRYTQSNKAVANLSIATTFKDRQGEERTNWQRVQAWGKCAEGAARLSKGDHVVVIGRVQTRKWQDKDGKDRFSTETVSDGPVFKAVWPAGDRAPQGAPTGEPTGEPQGEPDPEEFPF